jgi:hypothetical protein
MTLRLLLGVLLLAQSADAPSQTAPSFEVGFPPSSAAIEPTWIYTTPLHWKHAPRGIDESETFAMVVVLYPEGQYLEIDGALIKNEKNPIVGFSHGDGLLYRAGTWERTDDRVIRIHRRDVYWSTETVSKYKCDPTLPDRPCHFEEPHPGPITIDTCGLEGQSPTHLAQRIHCKAMILQPSRLNLDLSELQRMATEAFRAEPKP